MNVRLLPLGVLVVLFGFTSIASAENSCCSDHGGINSCDVNAELLRCNDGTLTQKCVCSADTHINQKHLVGGPDGRKVPGSKAVASPVKKSSSSSKAKVTTAKKKTAPVKKKTAAKKIVKKAVPKKTVKKTAKKIVVAAKKAQAK